MQEDLVKLAPYISLITSIIYLIGGLYRLLLIVL